ncbi:MAG: hypothetical protein QW165_05185 [Candidatus Woesearchaeota archaeon]
MQYRDKILSMAQTAPLLPSNVAKALNTNSIMAGAMLSEMCAKGMLKTSTLKVGGSPLYYVPGKETQLLQHINSLNEKDRRTVQKLQEEKIIRESEADPLTRVSLQTIKDFAKPLIVQYDGKQETFWKWFEISDKEAEEHIRQRLESQKSTTETQKVPIETQAKTPETPKTEFKKQKPIQETLAPKPALPTGDFWDKLQLFFQQSNITLHEKTVVKKKTEFDLIVELPSPVGILSYYCKARSKKKITDGDISAAYVQGQIKKLPVIFLTDGELTKQAQAVLSQLKGITVKKV